MNDEERFALWAAWHDVMIAAGGVVLGWAVGPAGVFLAVALICFGHAYRILRSL